jgi:glycerol transport system ATP-binding protein
MSNVVVRGASHRYGADAWVLEDFELAVEDGEAHALLGPSGVGKTTVLNLLSGLITPTRGQVLFDGVDVTRSNPRERNIAQVFQFPVLYEAMRVRDNLAFPLRNRRLPAPSVARRVAVIAELLEIEDLLDVKPAALSPYDKQRVALGRGLVREDVSAVLLDEPLTAVEPAIRWRLRRALREVRRELGVTMIFVTHDQLEALTFADRVSVLSGGRIIQTATPETLMDDPRHEFVGYFIGNPGMNLVDGVVRDGGLWIGATRLANVQLIDGPCRVGFRAEHARVNIEEGAQGVPVDVTSVRQLGVREAHPWGLLTVQLGGEQLFVRQRIQREAPFAGRLWVDPDKTRLFRESVRIDEP